MIGEERLLTLAEAQQRLGVGRSVLLRLIAAGALAGRKVGMRRGSWRVAEGDIRAYVQQQQMLTVADIQERLSVSRSTVVRLIRAGKLPAHKIGHGRGSWRLSGSDLETYIRGAQTRERFARVREAAEVNAA
ncbi:MAG: helix-turn-helix domain-containing protein [Anaerolineae bacterium]